MRYHYSMNDISRYLVNVDVLTYAVVFSAGIVTSFTPCVYPLVPIISAVIGATGERSKKRNIFLSLAYVTGMSLTFSLIGVFAAITGRLFGEIQSNSIANLVVGGLIIFFALALLGEFQLPVHLINRFGAGKKHGGRSAFPVFIMGLTSGLIAAPCATAVIGALLAFVASKQNIFLGFSLLFVYSMGLGAMLVLVGAITGMVSSLRKSGPFAKIVEKVLAVAMIILGCYYVFKAGTLSV
ncbi:MAG: sulfite exporter TauE/SafE family protein [Candidatus Omnitrophica bacterium]|nr:sulfite exporter TauE/SafE family protein [Candidatus Omnitrophota bacterium]